MFRGGVRSFVKKYEDDTEETFHYKARTPEELAAHFGALQAFTPDAPGAVARQAHLAKFIAASMCDEAGNPVITAAEAAKLTATNKAEIANLIATGSNESGDAGKG